VAKGKLEAALDSYFSGNAEALTPLEQAIERGAAAEQQLQALQNVAVTGQSSARHPGSLSLLVMRARSSASARSSPLI
jgi:hypothetical protein